MVKTTITSMSVLICATPSNGAMLIPLSVGGGGMGVGVGVFVGGGGVLVGGSGVLVGGGGVLVGGGDVAVGVKPIGVIVAVAGLSVNVLVGNGEIWAKDSTESDRSAGSSVAANMSTMIVRNSFFSFI